jgi:photosystem I subunit 3
MRRLFALALILFLWIGFVPSASANDVSGLQRCADVPAFQQRANNARTPAAHDRFERYSNLLCGPEGLPHLVTDGRLSHAGEFTIPGLIFLYIAGLIGWSGRTYIIWARNQKEPELNEIVINVPKAVSIVLSSLLWPLLAVKEILSGELTAQETEIPVSPR